MKRFHLHVDVRDLDMSIGFYSQLFGSAPRVHRPGYTKWLPDDPRPNFAISQRERAAGVDQLGLRAEDCAGLEEIGARPTATDAVSLAETDTTCCYALSDKSCAQDPQGRRRECFYTHGNATTYSAQAHVKACCAPQPTSTKAAVGANCRPATGQARCG